MVLRSIPSPGNSLRYMIPRSLRCWSVAFLGSAIAVSAQTPPTPTPTVNPAAAAVADDEMIDGIKLTDATIDHVLALLEFWTGKTVLRPQQLPTPTFAINLQRRLPKSEAVLALETLLNLDNIAVIPAGDKYLKVVDLPRARMEAPQMIEGSVLDLPPSGQIASKLFQLEFQRVNEFLPQINMLLNGNMGGYVVFEKSNAALVTDSISNLQRIESLVKKLDQPLTQGLTTKFFTVHNAKASDLVTKINSIVTGTLQSQLGSSTHFSADDRTNQIVLLADSRQYPFFADLIDKLDVRADPNTRTEVIYLKHAQAKDVSTLLSNLISGQTKATQNGTGKPNVISNTPSPQANAPGQPPAPTVAALSDAAGATNEFSGLIDIQPDERSNAIVVSGVSDDIRLIRDLITKVDVLLPQVRIEVVIAEVTLTGNESSGINSLGIVTSGSRVTSISADVAGVNGGSSGTGTVPVTAGITYNPATGGHALGLTAILAPLANRSNVEFLSAPTIVTIHNKESKIEVTNKQPVISSINQAAGYTNTGSSTTGVTSNPFNTSSSVTYQDIGIQLTVKALVGVDNSIQMDVDQVVDDVEGAVTIDGNSQPIIGHREAKSSVNVYSDEMIVLGGLQRNRKQTDRGKFGILYPIPILGSLFGPHTNKVDRTELLVFIRPHVIKPEENLVDTNRQINQQSESDVIKAFINPDTRADPEKAAEKTKKDRKKEEKRLKKEGRSTTDQNLAPSPTPTP